MADEDHNIIYQVPGWITPEKQTVLKRINQFHDWYQHFGCTSLKVKSPKVKDMTREQVLKKIEQEKECIRDGSLKLINQSASNKLFDRDSQCFVMKDTDRMIKPQDSTKQVYSRVLDTAEVLCKSNRSRTLRNVYYSAIKIFKNQQRSDRAIHALCTKIGCSRTALNLIPGDRGNVIGPITFKVDKKNVDCNSESDADNRLRVGEIVPAYLSSVTNMENRGAKFVLVVESYAVYQELCGENFHNDYGCIIMTGKGMSDQSFRAFIRYITDTFNIPAFFLSDCDPWGIEIFSVYKFGSENLASDSENLAIPRMYWLGVFPTDLTALNIPSEDMNVDDVRKARLLLEKEFISCDDMLAKQLDYMVQHNKKASILALSEFGLLHGLSKHYLLYKLYHRMTAIMEELKLDDVIVG